MNNKISILLAAIGVIFSTACYFYFRHEDPKNSYAVFIITAVMSATALLGRLLKKAR